VSDAKITADTSNGSLKGNISWDRDGDSNGTAILGKGTYTVDLNTSNGSVTVDTAE
jgi:flagellar hook assembly protein FlgD